MTEPAKPVLVVPVVEPTKTVEPPKVESPKVEVPKKVAPPTREVSICNRLAEIIAEHGGLESNIPAVKSHEYWQLKSELNALRTSAS